MGEEHLSLDANFDDDYIEDGEDVEMLDVEEGELVEDETPQTDVGKSSGGEVTMGNQGAQSKNQRRRANKKRNRKRRNSSGQKPVDVDRFVLETCRRLREKKKYMVYTAVGVLGFSAFSDIVREVDAIQACGGQMTADGKRNRTGGGILWNIIKAREPAAYGGIMKKTKEFEKQFKKQNIRQPPRQDKEGSSRVTVTDGASSSAQDDSQFMPQNQPGQFSSDAKRKSVHERIRVPVLYDDLLGDDAKADLI
ncbi:hypothetical protein SLE2022_188010 [Rubroshorea leprosula]